MLPFGAQGYVAVDVLAPPATTPMWSAGDSLDVAAAGDTVASFSASVVAPDPLSGLSPGLGATGTEFPVSHSVDWTISWTPGSSSSAKVVLILSTHSTAAIKCVADDSSGTLSIPSTLLGQIPVDLAELTLGRATLSEPACSNASVEVVAVAFLYWGVNVMP